jgi:AraC family transcriptional regulator of adaptative response / DNA-3-methyladenine glycosylase II
VRAVLGQQITVKGATTLAGTLARTFGRPYGLAYIFPRPEDLQDADFATIGLTKARAATIRGLARAVCEGKISFEGVVEPEGFLSRLCEIPGIGTWTAQYIAMRALGEPDAFPSGDIGLLRALGLKNSAELERRSEAWRPWRAYATMYLWGVPVESIAAVAPAAGGDTTPGTGTAQQRMPMGI